MFVAIRPECWQWKLVPNERKQRIALTEPLSKPRVDAHLHILIMTPDGQHRVDRDERRDRVEGECTASACDGGDAHSAAKAAEAQQRK